MAEATLPKTTPNDDEHRHQLSQTNIKCKLLKLVDDYLNDSVSETDENLRKEKLQKIYDFLKQAPTARQLILWGSFAEDQPRHLEKKYGDNFIELAHEIACCFPDEWWKEIVWHRIVVNHLILVRCDLAAQLISVALGDKKLEEVYAKFEKLQALHTIGNSFEAYKIEMINLKWDCIFNHTLETEFSWHQLTRKPRYFANLMDEIINYSPDLDWKKFAGAFTKGLVCYGERNLQDDLLNIASVIDKDVRGKYLHKIVNKYLEIQKIRKSVGQKNLEFYLFYPCSDRLRHLEKMYGSNFISLIYEIISFCPDSGWKEFASRVLQVDEHIRRDLFDKKDLKLNFLYELLKPSGGSFEKNMKKIATQTTDNNCKAYNLETLDHVFGLRDQLKQKCDGDLRKVFYRAISVIPDESWKEFVRISLGLQEAEIGEFDSLSRKKKFKMLLAWSKQHKQKTGRDPTTDEFLDILMDFLDEKDLIDGVLEQLRKSDHAKETRQTLLETCNMKLVTRELKQHCGGNRNKAFYKAIDLVPGGRWEEFVRVSLELDEEEIGKYHFDSLSRDRKYEMLQAWAKHREKTTGKVPDADEFLDILGEFLKPLGIPVQNIFIKKMVTQNYEEVNAQNFSGLVKNCCHCK